jgi:hypothetical protein
MKKIVFVLILILITVTFLSADIYVKSMQQTKAFDIMGKRSPERMEINEQWLGKNKFAQFSKDVNIIVDYDKKIMFLIINKDKIYFELPLNFDRSELLEILPKKIADIVKAIKITDVLVNADIEKKKIANWDCYSTEFSMVFMIPEINIMPKFKMKMWLTKDLPFDYKEYKSGMDEFMGQFITGILNVDIDSEKEFEKLDKIEGFSVGSEVVIEIFGSAIKVESQILEVTEKKAPLGIYSPPKGFTKKSFDSILRK